MSRDPQFAAYLVEAIPRLRRYARVLTGEPARGDDLVQDTLERAWERRGQWRPDTELRPWLFSIMHNRHVDTLRRQAVVPMVELDPADEPAHRPFDRALEALDLERGLASLPTEHREVLMLVTVEQLSYQEVADALGVPIGTVMSRLSRARDRLRAALQFDAPVTPLRRVK